MNDQKSHQQQGKNLTTTGQATYTFETGIKRHGETQTGCCFNGTLSSGNGVLESEISSYTDAYCMYGVGPDQSRGKFEDN